MLPTIQLRDQIWWNTNNIDKFKDGVTLIGQVTLIFANSATRYVSINYESVVWWQSKKQATIALSSMEVEYIVAAHATKEVMP